MDIKNIARKKGVTMEQVAAKIGISKGGLSKALKGNPTLKTLRAVAEVLQVPVTEFFADEVKPVNITRNSEQLMQQTVEHGGKHLRITIEELS